MIQNLAKLWTKWERHGIDLRKVFGPTGRTCGRNVERRRGQMWTSGTPKILPKSFPGGSPRHPKSLPAPSPSTLEHRKTTCDTTGAQKITKKSRKSAESRPKEAVLRPKWDPKIDQKRARDRKSAFGDAVGSDFCRCRAPLPFTVDLEINFWKV